MTTFVEFCDHDNPSIVLGPSRKIRDLAIPRVGENVVFGGVEDAPGSDTYVAIRVKHHVGDNGSIVIVTLHKVSK